CFFFRLPPPPRSTPFPYTTLFRSHAKLPRRDEPVDPLGVPAQAEEVVGLLHPDEIERRVFHAAPVDDLRLLLELLAAHAVQPLVLAREQVVGMPLADAVDERGDGLGVPRLGRADPVV